MSEQDHQLDDPIARADRMAQEAERLLRMMRAELQLMARWKREDEARKHREQSHAQC